MAKRVVTIVLMKRRGEDALNPQIFVRLIREGMPEIAAVPGCSLAKLRIRSLRLRDACLTRHKDDGGVVEAVFKRCLELVLCRVGWQLYVSAHRAKVRHDAQDALGLFS